MWIMFRREVGLIVKNVEWLRKGKTLSDSGVTTCRGTERDFR
jgi:hypothetical protein